MIKRFAGVLLQIGSWCSGILYMVYGMKGIAEFLKIQRILGNMCLTKLARTLEKLHGIGGLREYTRIELFVRID